MDALGGNSLFEPVDEVVDDVLFENSSSGAEQSESNDDGAGKQETGGGLDLGFELPDLGNPGLNRKLEKAIEDVLEESGTITQEQVQDIIYDLVAIGAGRKFGKGGDGDDNISIRHDEGATAYGGKGNDTLTGGKGADKLIGKWGSNLLDGGDGDDVARGGDGADSILGGLGADRGIGGDGDDMIEGGAGNDILRGDKGRDTIDGGDDDDRLFGFADEDSIMGGNGDDIVRGGLANDSLWGGAGNDVLRGGEDEDLVEGGDGNDRLYGGNGNDSLKGDAGNDRLEGQSGRDTLDGGEGDDNLRGGSEDDLIFGGLGDDFVLGGTGDDQITGSEGADTVHGESGADSITGDEGNDRLFGGNGRDTVDGGIGDDVVNGGSEDDLLSGGDGDDTLGGASGDDVVTGGAGDDQVNGGAGDDTLSGGAGADAIDGGANADIIDGGDGNDSITGGSGNDSMTGGAGHDVFISDAGDDTMSGGEGSEWYVYQNEAFGHDLIEDFDAAGGDLLDLSRTGLTRADLNIRQVTEDMVTIDVPDGRSITLAGQSEFDINTAAIYFGPDDGAVELHDFIVNGSFEQLDVTGDVLGAYNGNGNGHHDASEVVWYRSVEGWSSKDGQVEIKGEAATNTGAIRTSNGSFYAELDDGSSLFENNEIHQDVQDLAVGRSYTLSFDFANHAGNSDGHVDVYFGGEKIATVSSNSGGFSTKTFDVTGGAGDGSDRLSFVTPNSGNEAGAYIDNVRLQGYVDTDGALTPVPDAPAEGGDDTVTGGEGEDTVAGGVQEFIVNGSFEDFSNAGRVNDTYNSDRDGVHESDEVFWYDRLEGWTSRDGDIELKGEDFAGSGGIRATDGDFYVELDDGSGRSFHENNDLRQDVQGLSDGETYTLTFDSANRTGHGDGHVDVFFGGEKIGTVTSNSSSFQQNSFEIVGGSGDGSDRLIFTTPNSNNEAGALIDNVSMTGAAPAGSDSSDPVFDGELIEGDDGRDFLKGTSRDDVIRGLGSRDTLSGRDGDDTLIGGGGDDKLFGGDGADTFVFDAADFGDDKIYDFDAGEGDRLDFSKVANELSELHMFEARGDTHIRFSDGSSVELEDVRMRDFDAEEVFLFG